MESDVARRPDNDPVGTAPGPLRLVEEFINTRREDRDDIGTPEQLRDWLSARGLAPGDCHVSDSQRRRAELVREGLRASIADNNGEAVVGARPDGLDPAARARFAEVSIGLTLVLDLAGGQPRLVPAAQEPVEAALATLLSVVSEATAAGTWSRLKACRDASCRWAFYDHSRNRQRSWCSMDICGNRAKARTFYIRNSAARDQSVPPSR
ncbi:CGNR zinc finger domain-containing protein [Mumia sp. ZJ1417]|uniref:CGNR zinc finger domain-containing protein n=1 Tax=Mumia sp. ZJ1417 TaxID=2708082 RepID=UPI00141FC254|nr:CGNR zinc finger domain-containing protein [Mumia sp. ZJ1417]QMW67920.1 CGNR zinc finger domain-containing protein [Mumia sp. ZJ1417]